MTQPNPIRQARRLLRSAHGRARRARTVDWGNIGRGAPFSHRYGRDRGQVIDRLLLDTFFERHQSDIRGDVLEVRDPGFTERFGSNVSSIEVVDIDPTNRHVTLLGDLQDEGLLPMSTFDCIVFPQTLQYLDNPAKAIAALVSALRPSGVLLLTVPALQQVDHHLAAIDKWRFLPAGLTTILDEGCGDRANSQVEVFGSTLQTVGFLIGASVEDLPPRSSTPDPMRPLVLGARVRRTKP